MHIKKRVLMVFFLVVGCGLAVNGFAGAAGTSQAGELHSVAPQELCQGIVENCLVELLGNHKLPLPEELATSAVRPDDLIKLRKTQRGELLSKYKAAVQKTVAWLTAELSAEIAKDKTLSDLIREGYGFRCLSFPDGSTELFSHKQFLEPFVSKARDDLKARIGKLQRDAATTRPQQENAVGSGQTTQGSKKSKPDSSSP